MVTGKRIRANDPQPFDGYPATYWADWAISSFDHVCMKDADTGEYCVGVFLSNFYILQLSSQLSITNSSYLQM